MTAIGPLVGPPRPPEAQEAALRQAARDLEASFLALMLKDAGVGNAPSGFGGGIGEEQFASFLREAYAAKISEAGGLGLAESLYHALRARADG